MNTMPWTQGITNDEMDKTLQEEVENMADLYHKNVFEENSGEEIVFAVGEGTMPEAVLQNLDLTSDELAVRHGNTTAAAIYRVADQVLEETNAETAILYDMTDQAAVNNSPLGTNDLGEVRTSPLDIVGQIGEHYEDVEGERRANEIRDQYDEVLSQTGSEEAALDSVETNAKPVFAKTMSDGYMVAKNKEIREERW